MGSRQWENLENILNRVFISTVYYVETLLTISHTWTTLTRGAS